MKSEELKKYIESDDRWAVCSDETCDTDFQPRREKEGTCPVCKSEIGYWVDERYEGKDLDDYLRDPDEEDEESVFIDAVWYPMDFGMEEFMTVIGSQVEKVFNKSNGKRLFLHAAHSEERDLWGYVITSQLHVNEYDIEEFFMQQIALEERDSEEEGLARMSDEDYEEHLKERKGNE